ncbi:phytanoyl-CoA dioxygenase family protein [Sporichthya sp.]|uniref:phytanoyl-CoA dioxygenase family protein n=1 Tax=Sporichthya sp. TaxID=65475 RepID=UPI00179E6591|nr:phytanoyl-CoA dioxygenase family protein [Sporichthya sp.]MBA3744778.1 phytanoyl-CoA dioxygenase family protein [Sporichthya sp.]
MSATILPTAGLTRRLSEAERDDLRRDGVVVARGILSEELLATMHAATERVMADVDASDKRRPVPPFRAWVLDAPLVGLTRQALPGASCVTVYVDQIVGHRPGSGELLTVNREAPYVPVMGKQVVRLWVPLNTVKAGGGAVRYLRGSHRGPGQGSDWLVAEAEVGDVVLHHPRAVHGAIEDGDHHRVVASAYGADLRRGPQAADDLLREWESFHPFLNPKLPEG